MISLSRSHISSFSALITFSFFQNSLSNQPVPQMIPWSSKVYGPDGPWQAVTISIGTPSQTVDLLPGGSWMTNILAPSICSSGISCDIPKSAGFFDRSTSSTVFCLDSTGSIDNTSLSGWVGGLPALFGCGNWIFDTLSMSFAGSPMSHILQVNIPYFDMLILTSAYETLPSGSTYPAQIGKLSLGAPDANQTWANGRGPHFNASFFPSWLYILGITPSNSYGLHIGSAALKISGSLNIGGYDQSRVLGPVSTQLVTIDQLPIDLLDISLGVATGDSPFPFVSKSGLLAEGNPSIGVAMPVTVDATLPYIYLPQSTCDNIVKYLPVTYQPDLGLYTWNTNDPKYNLVVSSPAYLRFTFRLDSSITLSQNLTINVPFPLLNLTLTPPIVNNPMAYFPLRPLMAPYGNYALGRAFMQAAFVGANWGKGVWFLGQAPGPNTPRNIPITTIGAEDIFIIGSGNSWGDSWTGEWSVIRSNGSSGNEAGSVVGSNSSSGNGAGTGSDEGKPGNRSSTDVDTSAGAGNGQRGMSSGKIAATIVSSIASVSLLIALGYALYHRVHPLLKASTYQGDRQAPRRIGFGEGMFPGLNERGQIVSSSEKSYGGAGFPPRELEAGSAMMGPVELST